jgi:hypothetical protein
VSIVQSWERDRRVLYIYTTDAHGTIHLGRARDQGDSGKCVSRVVMVSVYVNVSGYTSSQIKAYRDEHFTNQAEVLAQKDRKNKKGGPAVQAHIRWRAEGALVSCRLHPLDGPHGKCEGVISLSI